MTHGRMPLAVNCNRGFWFSVTNDVCKCNMGAVIMRRVRVKGSAVKGDGHSKWVRIAAPVTATPWLSASREADLRQP